VRLQYRYFKASVREEYKIFMAAGGRRGMSCFRS
jgi:hypothetical protein